MAVKGYAYRMPVDELIDALMIREIPLHHQPVDKRQVGEFPGQVDIPAVDSQYLDDPIRVLWREGQRRAVEIDHHPGYGSIYSGFHGTAKIKERPGRGITVPADLLLRKGDPAGDLCRNLDATMRDRDKKGIFHGYCSPVKETEAGVFVNVCMGEQVPTDGVISVRLHP
jgi:hypothetical protein